MQVNLRGEKLKKASTARLRVEALDCKQGRKTANFFAGFFCINKKRARSADQLQALAWKGCTNSMPFEFLTYMFEPLHVLNEIFFLQKN